MKCNRNKHNSPEWPSPRDKEIQYPSHGFTCQAHHRFGAATIRFICLSLVRVDLWQCLSRSASLASSSKSHVDLFDHYRWPSLVLLEAEAKTEAETEAAAAKARGPAKLLGHTVKAKSLFPSGQNDGPKAKRYKFYLLLFALVLSLTVIHSHCCHYCCYVFVVKVANSIPIIGLLPLPLPFSRSSRFLWAADNCLPFAS